jgi:hypothetical protein
MRLASFALYSENHPMKNKLLVTVSALIISGSFAFAQESAPEIVLTPVEAQIAELSLDGFKRFEVKTGLTQTKIEAINPETLDKLEIVIDSATGDVLSTEAGKAGMLENIKEGTFYRTRNRDFVEVDDNGADTSDDSSDDNSDEANADDDNGADTSGNSSDDDSSGDDSSDDSSNSLAIKTFAPVHPGPEELCAREIEDLSPPFGHSKVYTSNTSLN